MNLAALVAFDFRLLWRHGFALAYIVIAALYAAIVSAIPRDWADAVLPVLAWSDPAFFCFFFAGASVCLDLDQGTFQALFASPLRPAVYLAVKAANLSVLAFLMAAAVSASARGLKTVNRFLMGSMPVFLVLALPVVEYAAGPWLPAWFGVLARATPSDGALRFARAAYAGVPPGELVGAAFSAIVWTVVVAYLFLGPAVDRARGD